MPRGRELGKLTPNERGTVYEIVEHFRSRPSSHVRGGRLDAFEAFLHGYYRALYIRGIVENCPALDNHFLIWVLQTKRLSTCAGFAVILASMFPDPDAQRAMFFELIDEYRQLRPTVVRVAGDLNEAALTKTAARYGWTEGDSPATAVELLCYQPSRLYFVRCWFAERAHDDWLLMDGNGSHWLSLKRAMELASHYTGVPTEAWKAPTSRELGAAYGLAGNPMVYSLNDLKREVLERMPLEERLAGLSPEERLRGLPSKELLQVKALLAKLEAGEKKPVKKRRRKP